MDCSRCGVCCKLFLINLSKDEYGSKRFKTVYDELEDGFVDDFDEAEMIGANIILQNDDGSCTYLKDGACSIHQERPGVCRKFFCESKDEQFKGMIKKISEAKA